MATISPTHFVPVSPAIPNPMDVHPGQLVQFGVEIPNRVFVGGCPYNMTEKELADFFKQFGPIKDTKIVFDKATGKSLGYGFVTYNLVSDAINVYTKGSIYYKEKKLNVSKAVRKHGGQFIRPHQELINMVQPNTGNGYLVTQDGLWTPYSVPSHAQPVKPYYTVYVGQQPGVAYSVQSPPTLAPMGTGYVFSPLPQPSSPVEQKVAVQEISADVEQDSAYSSDDHTPVTNESEQGGGDTFQGVDLDRLFERRHSKKRREACFIPSPGHGLLPTPAIVGITSLPQ